MKTIQIFTFLLLSLTLMGQDKPGYSISNIQPATLKDANTVIRNNETSFHFKSYKTAQETQKLVITRLNANAHFESLYINYDMHSEVKKVHAAIYDANGKLVRKFKKNEIKDNGAYDGVTIATDSRYKSIDFSYGVYPYTLELEYTMAYKGIYFFPSQYPYWRSTIERTSVENWAFTLITPPDLPIDYKAYNFTITPTKSVNTEQQSVLTFNASGFPAVKLENLGPTGADLFPVVRFKTAHFGVDEYDGSMEDWTSFGKFMYRLNAQHNNLSEEMQAEVKKMTANATTDYEKIDILYRYIQDNMRYVSVQLGIGGWRSFDAAYVEKNKYGDCKALTWFMKSMLETIGIESVPALVLAGEGNCRTRQTEDFCFPNFNHVILNVPQEDVWLECTSNFNPTNYLGSFTDDRMVMLIKESGGELVYTPAVSAEENKRYQEASISISEAGSASVKTEVLYVGPKHEYFRYRKELLSEEELEKWFLQSTNLPSARVENIGIKVEKDHPKALLNYEVTVAKYGSKSGKRMFIPINSLNAFENNLSFTKERKYLVQIRRGFMNEDKIVIDLPEGYEVESIPQKNLQITTEFGMYDLKIEQQPGQLIYHRKLKIQPTQMPAERYEELRDFYKKMAKADNMKVVLVEKKT